MKHTSSIIHSFQYILGAFAILCCLPTASAQWVRIENGKLWLTADGDTVQAHAPGFLREGNTWYMIGEDRSREYRPDVNLYKSTDLQHWTFVRKIIGNGVTSPELGTSRMIERAKLLRNPRTGRYVVWCHWEASDYGASEAACLESDAVDGDYRLVWSGRPLGIKSRDCNVFQDIDGTAYFISTTEENRHLGLFKLSDDYLSARRHTQLFPEQRREAPVIVRLGGKYYMFSSACSGWTPNQCKVSVSTNLTGGWSPLENIGDDKAFRTQIAAVLEIRGTRQTTYLYVGDRWKDPTLAETKTILFPITFHDGKCEFHYMDSFELNLQTGEWREK